MENMQTKAETNCEAETSVTGESPDVLKSSCDEAKVHNGHTVISFEKLLARDGRLVYKTRGVSMEPMLRQNRDIVVISTTDSRLKPLDVALYKRGDDNVLHRVIEVKDGFYLIRGDNTYSLEKVPDSAVLGVLTSFQRKGKSCEVTDPTYLLYSRVWNDIYPLRAAFIRFRRLSVRLVRLFIRKKE